MKDRNLKRIILHFALSFCILIFAFFISADPAQAAVFEVSSSVQEIGLNQQFVVELTLDVQGQSLNALEGRIVFLEDILSLSAIRDGDSIVSIWVDRPAQKEATERGYQQVYFSGVMPGGFEGVMGSGYKGGRPGKVLSLVFLAKNTGRGTVDVKNAKALLNDGLGTEAFVSVLPLSFEVKQEAQETAPALKEDNDAPEPFTPEISRNPELFEGRYFLVFLAQDKGSGIDHYEVAERRGYWKEAASPFVLRDQALKSTIYVKAVDRAGNERVVVLPSTNELSWFDRYFILIILIVGVLALLLWNIVKR